MNRLKYFCVIIYLFVFCANCFQLRLFLSDAHNLIFLSLIHLILVAFFCIVAIIKNLKAFNLNDKFLFYCVLIVFFTFFPNILGCMRDGRSVIFGCYKSGLSLAIFIYFPLKCFFNTREDFKMIFDAALYVLLAYLVFSILAAFTSLKYQIAFDAEDIDQNLRFGLTRIIMSPFFIHFKTVILFYSFFLLFRSNNNKNALLTIGLILFYMLFVCMGRREVLSIFVSLALLLFANMNKLPKIALSIILFGGVALLCYYIIGPEIKFTDHLTNFINSYNRDDTNISVRVDGINSFYAEFIQTKGWGVGDLSITNEEANAGQKQKYNPNDLGIFTTLFVYGIPAMLVTIYVSLSIVRRLFHLKKHYTGTPFTQDLANSILMFYLYHTLSLQAFYYYRASATFWGVLFYMVYMIQKEYINSGPRNRPYPYLER